MSENEVLNKYDAALTKRLSSQNLPCIENVLVYLQKRNVEHTTDNTKSTWLTLNLEGKKLRNR